jgi:hypothetical protein
VALAALGAVTALGVTLAAVRLVLGLRPPALGAGDAVVTTNVAAEVVSGRAPVASPTGAALGPDRFVDVRALSVLPQDRPLRDAGASSRRWLYMHPPASVSVDLDVPPDAYFQAGLALDPATWDAPLGDGVRFLVSIVPAGGVPAGGSTGGLTETVLVDAAVNPRARGEQRRWLDVVADLRPWAGQRVRLTLRTDARQDPLNDWAGWSEPAVVRLDPITAARLQHSAAEIARLALQP